MTQNAENTTDISQVALLKKFAEIIEWMRKFEQHRYEEKKKANAQPLPQLEEKEMTQHITQEGWCFGLSSRMMSAAMTQEQIWQKKHIKGKEDIKIDIDPETTELLYETIAKINSVILPHDLSSSDATKLYGELNIFYHLTTQLQSSGRAIKQTQVIENALIEAGHKRKKLQTYIFNDKQQLIDWAKAAEPGDSLSIDSQNHTMSMYVIRNSDNKKIVGFYDPNNNTKIEMASSII